MINFRMPGMFLIAVGTSDWNMKLALNSKREWTSREYIISNVMECRVIWENFEQLSILILSLNVFLDLGHHEKILCKLN